MPEILWQPVGVGLGIATWYAAGRGWLGYRVSGRARSVAAGIAAGLVGTGVIRFAASSISNEGLVPFLTVWTLAIVVGVAISRAVRSRWPTAGVLILASVPLILFLPGLFGSIAGSVIAPILVLGSLIYLHRLMLTGRWER